MKYGCLRVCALSPRIIVGRPLENAKILIAAANAANAQITLFPELSLTGATAGDLFLRRGFIDEAMQALQIVANRISGLAFIGLPIMLNGHVYNCMGAVAGGRILGFVPKMKAQRGANSLESRWIADGADIYDAIDDAPINTNLKFTEEESGVCVSVVFGSDLRSNMEHIGADVLVCPDAMSFSLGDYDLMRTLINAEAKKLLCVAAYANAGEGESTAEGVYEGEAFVTGGEIADIELCRNQRLARGMSDGLLPAESVCFNADWADLEILPEHISKRPFLSENAETRAREVEKIVEIQAVALYERLRRIGLKKAIVGVSGGLDSTLALIAASEAMKLMNVEPNNLIAVTMPGFGTSSRTHDNANALMTALGVDMREISIAAACRTHLADIGHDGKTADVAYENAQARERTQILMDLANMEKAMVVGTGDLSELALGFCTYGGDHLSMYGVNASVPKTVIREVVRHWGDIHPELKSVLYDIAETPISPELTPAQKTEEIVGKYELIDFFMYHLLVNGFSKDKVRRYANIAFSGEYSDDLIAETLSGFERRFFTQQFKRSCAPDGPKITQLSFSPRGGLMLPSDVKGGF